MPLILSKLDTNVHHYEISQLWLDSDLENGQWIHLSNHYSKSKVHNVISRLTLCIGYKCKQINVY
jgi:hypothetical protein